VKQGALATPVEDSVAQILLVEPNHALRSAIVTVLDAERYAVEACDSLDMVMQRTVPSKQSVALVAWQSMNGLLADDHRAHHDELTQRLRLVLMVPRRWLNLLEQTDLRVAFAGVVAKPFEADELLDTVRYALRRAPADA
jgi:DNA-binding response OmpR family regulator